MQPINYDVPVGNPFESMMQGEQMGAQILAQRQQAAAQQQMRTDLDTLAKNPNPTAQDYAAISLKYPSLVEPFQKIWGSLDKSQQQSTLNSTSKIYAALQSGNGQVAADIIQKQADALRNSGNEAEARGMEQLKQSAIDNPTSVMPSMAGILAAALGPDKFAENFKVISATPYNNRIQEAEADNAAAKYDLANRKTMEDIDSSKLKRQIDIADLQIRNADTDIKRQELQLKRDQLQAKLDSAETKAGDPSEKAQKNLDQVNDQLDAVNRILSNDLTEGAWFRGGVGNNMGLLTTHIPGSDRKDLDQLVETVKSQQFLTNLAELKASGGTLGQVTEKEGERLEKALASLDTNQSPEAFRAAVTRIKKSLERIQQQIIASGKLPTSESQKGGGTFVMKHPKEGNITEAYINDLIKQDPGTTREEVIEYLNRK